MSDLVFTSNQRTKTIYRKCRNTGGPNRGFVLRINFGGMAWPFNPEMRRRERERERETKKRTFNSARNHWREQDRVIVESENWPRDDIRLILISFQASLYLSLFANTRSQN